MKHHPLASHRSKTKFKILNNFKKHFEYYCRQPRKTFATSFHGESRFRKPWLTAPADPSQKAMAPHRIN